MGTVKYFGYTATENAVPNLPVFKSLRDKLIYNETYIKAT